MAYTKLNIRVDVDDIEIFKIEAAKRRMTLSDYVRDLLRLGFFYHGCKDVVHELKSAVKTEGDCEKERAMFEALLEVRNNLRILTLKEPPEHVEAAKKRAVEVTNDLLGKHLM